ncbi:MAG: hypothetical protein ABIP97_11165 [Chthoniobacterales bacterium]
MMSMIRIFVLLLCTGLSLVAREVDGIKTKENAVKIAEKGLQYLDKGEYAKAICVPLEGSPKYQEVLMGVPKTNEFEDTKQIIKTVRNMAGKVTSRRLVSVKKCIFPLGSPYYYVSFISETKRGTLKEKVTLRYRKSDTFKRSSCYANYKFDFKGKRGDGL